MNQAGDHFFPRAAFAVDQYRHVGARRNAHKVRPVWQKHHFASPMSHILAHLNPSERSLRGVPRITSLLLSLVFLLSYIEPKGHSGRFPGGPRGKNEG